MSETEFKFLTTDDLAEAACILVFNPLGQVLGIKRADGGVGLPGGKKNDDEDVRGCAIREALEETGLMITKMAPCFARKSDTGKFFVTTFWVSEYSVGPEGLKSSEEGEVVWMELWQLSDPSQCKFSNYNSHLTRAVCSSFAATCGS